MPSVARESVEHLAAHCGIPRFEVSLVAEGYDRAKHLTWAMCVAGERYALSAQPDGGTIRHECGDVTA